MKKTILILSLLLSSPVFAQVSYLQEATQLGSIAGQGAACKATKSATFDMLSRAIILSKAPNATARDSALKSFLDAKVKSYIKAKSDCQSVISVFDNQDIFNIKLYEEGTIIMPDGTKIVPKIPYDATQI